MRELAGRTAFVTGAASGIGLGIATALPIIDRRFAAIKQGFDRIRGRTPRH